MTGKTVELAADSIIDTHAALGRLQRIEDSTVDTAGQEAQAYSAYLRNMHNIPDSQACVLLHTNLGYCITFGDDAAVRGVVAAVNAAAAGAAA